MNSIIDEVLKFVERRLYTTPTKTAPKPKKA